MASDPTLAQPITDAFAGLFQWMETRSQGKHEVALAKVHAPAVNSLIDAVHHRRMDAIQSGFEMVMQQLSAQTAYYVDLKRQLSEELGQCNDALRAHDIFAERVRVDRSLRDIRITMSETFSMMLCTLTSLDAPPLALSGNVYRPLALIAGH